MARRQRYFGFERLTVIAAFAFLSACIQPQPETRGIQLCLGNPGGVAQFKNLLQAMAVKRGMKYSDASDSLARHLRAADVKEEKFHAERGAIHVSLDGVDGNLSALNTGLGVYEVVISMSPGLRPNEKWQFADAVIEELGKHWVIKPVPAGSGAL